MSPPLVWALCRSNMPDVPLTEPAMLGEHPAAQSPAHLTAARVGPLWEPALIPCNLCSLAALPVPALSVEPGGRLTVVTYGLKVPPITTHQTD